VDGARLPYVPKWSTGLDGEYKWAAFKDYSAFLGGTYSYVGSRRTDFASSATDPTGQATVGSYNQYDARLGLDNGRYRVTLYGKNLSDARGITNYTSAAAGSPYSTVTVTQPLTVGLSLSAKF
jgi:outer membrane receptor protein involved in Fe transport